METFLNRKVIEQHTFEKDAFHATVGWLHNNGYDFGDKDGNNYIPVMKGYYDRYEIPRQWNLLDNRQKKLCSRSNNRKHKRRTYNSLLIQIADV